MHAICFFPAISIWSKSINNRNYATFPVLTSDLVTKYLPLEVPTILDHQHKRRQCIRSTTARAANVQLMPEPQVDELCAKIIPLPRMMCTCQTGRVPVRSKSGNNNMVITYDYDANAMLAEPIPDLKSPSPQRGYIPKINTSLPVHNYIHIYMHIYIYKNLFSLWRLLYRAPGLETISMGLPISQSSF